MVKATMDIRVKSVVLYQEGVRTAKEICSLYNISERTLRRWDKAYQQTGFEGLKPKSTRPKKSKRAILNQVKKRILRPDLRNFALN